jgi:Asp-tRNA(Asn)/Glu-tRNA(Gln) amidotransferase A subunit family amidase
MHVATGLRSCRPGSLARNSSSSLCRAAKASVIRDIQRSLRNKDRSAVEITQSYLDNIARTEPSLNSYITVSAQQALEQVNLSIQLQHKTFLGTA